MERIRIRIQFAPQVSGTETLTDFSEAGIEIWPKCSNQRSNQLFGEH
jgi:hypothetical protein